ncbi:MAG: hypothetical protein ACK5QW_04045, partial [Cyanobacteriota bacterium]
MTNLFLERLILLPESLLPFQITNHRTQRSDPHRPNRTGLREAGAGAPARPRGHCALSAASLLR